jgi:hypothetical protein
MTVGIEREVGIIVFDRNVADLFQQYTQFLMFTFVLLLRLCHATGFPGELIGRMLRLDRALTEGES